MQSSPTLESWTSRIKAQLADVLEPAERFSDIGPTEALSMSLEAYPSLTLVSLARLAKEDDSSALRTLALVTLRQYAVITDAEGARTWDTVSADTQRDLQRILLECLQQDRPDEQDREAATLCRTCTYILDLLTQQGYPWPEFEEVLQGLLAPTSTLRRQRLFFTLVNEWPAVVADMQTAFILKCLQHGLQAADQSTQLVTEAVKASVALLKSDDRFEQLSPIVPEILQTLPLLLVQKAPSDLSKCIYSIVDLYEEDGLIPLLQPHLPQFIPFIATLLASTIVDFLRHAAVEFLTSTAEALLVEVKTDHLQQYGEIVQMLLEMMAQVRGDQQSEQTFWQADVLNEDSDSDETHSIAEDALNRLALALGSGCVLPAAFQIIPTMMAAEEWQKRYAALSAIGTLAESSSKDYQNNLDQMMQLVFAGLSDSNVRVIYSAVYAAAELCTYLSGETQARFGEPLLSSLFIIISTPLAPARLIAYSCAALVNFTSDLEGQLPEALAKHAPAFLQQLLQIITASSARDDVRLKAMSATAQIAATLGDHAQLDHNTLQAVVQIYAPYLKGDVDEAVKARAIDCTTLVASSVTKDMLAPLFQDIMASLIHIQHTHHDEDDPCPTQVLIGMTRLVEVMKVDFLPHIDALLPPLLRIANSQVDNAYDGAIPDEVEDNAMDESEKQHFYVHSAVSGKTIKVNSESLREKAQGVQLLTSVASSLGDNLIDVGESQNTTGDWQSYAETLLNLAVHLIAYEHSSEIRSASAVMLPSLVRAFATSTRYEHKYNRERMTSVVAPLLQAMSSESEPDVLAAQFAATSEIVLVAPDIFSAQDAKAFVGMCSEQLRELVTATQEVREAGDNEALETYAESTREALETMSSTLQAFIKTAGSSFPIQSLFNQLNMAMSSSLGLKGEKEWALRLICDLIQYASPAAVAWTSGHLEAVTRGLSDDEAIIRQTCAFAVGVAALNQQGSSSSFCRSSIEKLCSILASKPDLSDEGEVLAYDNAVSAVGKVLANANTLQISFDDLLPTWLQSLPIWLDSSEMEPTYRLLLDIIAREHPLVVAPENQMVQYHIAQALNSALSNPHLPEELRQPLSVGYAAMTGAQQDGSVAQ